MKNNASARLFSNKANLWLACSLLSGMFFFQISQATAQTVAEGLRLVEVEQSSKAVPLFSRMISTNPKDASLYYYRGYTFIQREKSDSAMADFNQGISINPKEALNYAGKGYVLLNQNKVAEAEAAFDEAMKISRNKNATVLNAIAEAYLNAESKNIVKAKQLLERSMQMDQGKTNPQTYLLLGDAFLMENNGGKAVSNYERATEMNKNSAKGYFSIAKVWARGRNYPLSRENFEKAISVDPNYAPAYRELGELYYRTNQVQKAKDAYAKYLEISDIRSASRDRYAIFLFLSKDYEKAISEINLALPNNPDNLVLNRLLGYALYETGNYAQGLTAMQKFFKIAKPDKVLSSDYEYLGKNLVNVNCDSLGLKNCDSLGIANLRKAIEMDSTKGDLRQSIADTYKKNKRYKEAAQEFSTMIKAKDTPTPTDYMNLGFLQFQSEQLVAADSSFTKVTQLVPTYLPGFLYKAKVEANLDPETTKGLAKSSYEKVIELGEADPSKNGKNLVEAYGYLGYYHLLKNDKTKALENFNKVLAIEPNNKRATESITFIKTGGKPAPAPAGKAAGTSKAATKSGTSKKPQ
jgi:tetratricopeptide (TPR) repeat protein